MCDRTPGHAEHDSMMLAENAATLHVLTYPLCSGVPAFPCGDHFHVGHRVHGIGQRCKAEHEGYHRGVPRRDTPSEQVDVRDGRGTLPLSQ